MAHKEHNVTEILDVLRRTQAGDGKRQIARATGIDRNTIRKYLMVAEECGFTPPCRAWKRFTRSLLQFFGRYIFPREMRAPASMKKSSCPIRNPYQAGSIKTNFVSQKFTANSCA